MLVALALLLQAATPADLVLSPRVFVDWDATDGPRSYAAADGARVTVEPVACGTPAGPSCTDDGTVTVPRVTLTVPGAAPVTALGELGDYFHFAVGRLDRRDRQPTMIVTSYTGGAHCCDVYRIARPTAAGYRLLPLVQPLRNGAERRCSTVDFRDFRRICRATARPTSSCRTMRSTISSPVMPAACRRR